MLSSLPLKRAWSHKILGHSSIIRRQILLHEEDMAKEIVEAKTMVAGTAVATATTTAEATTTTTTATTTTTGTTTTPTIIAVEDDQDQQEERTFPEVKGLLARFVVRLAIQLISAGIILTQIMSLKRDMVEQPLLHMELTQIGTLIPEQLIILQGSSTS
uniref:Uncharacterized protein n=1 Tax=Triticum urartu TaxID=4572 RepID=A0A8R7UEG2_TRIUA